MTFDPNSPIPRAPEVRVTARGVRLSPDSTATVQVSTRSDFVAPATAPVSTLALELDKGKAGWTAGPVPADKRPSYIIRAELARKAQREADIEELTITGTTVIRKAPAAPMVKLNRTGPRRNRRAK